MFHEFDVTACDEPARPAAVWLGSRCMLKDKLVNFLFEFPIAAWDTGDVVRILYDNQLRAPLACFLEF